MAFQAKYVIDNPTTTGAWGDSNYIISGKTGVVSHNGTYYGLGVNVYDGNVGIIKRTTANQPWSVMDNSNRPDGGFAYTPFLIQNGSILNVIYAYQNSGSGVKEVRMKQFNMATDLWTGSISNSGYGTGVGTGAVNVLGVSPLAGAGDFVVFFRCDDTSAADRRLWYGRYESGAWIAREAVQGTLSTSTGIGEVYHHASSGVTHFIWNDSLTYYTRSTNSSWVMAARQTVATLVGVHVENAALLGSEVFVGVQDRDGGGINDGCPAVLRLTANSSAPTVTYEQVDSTQQYNLRAPSLFVSGSTITAIYSPETSTGGVYWDISYATSTGGAWSARVEAIALRDRNSPYENINTNTAPSIAAVEPPNWVTEDIFQVAVLPTGGGAWTLLFSTIQQLNFSPFGLTYIPYFLEPEQCCCINFAFLL